MYGAYIGEVFRRAYGGSWELRTDVPLSTGPVVAITRPGGDTFFPTSKALKRLKNGEGDSVWFYFQVLANRATEQGH